MRSVLSVFAMHRVHTENAKMRLSLLGLITNVRKRKPTENSCGNPQLETFDKTQSNYVNPNILCTQIEIRIALETINALRATSQLL